MTLTRRVAAVAAFTLATAGLAGVAAPPAVAAGDATLTWSFSDYLAHQVNGIGFTGPQPSDGATADGIDVTFGDGAGTGSLASGDLHVSYEGSVTYSWHVDLTFSDPEVIVEGGNGKVVADVSWKTPATGSVDDVVLTTFDPATATLDGDTFSATPRWADAGSSWAPELLAALPDDVDAFFKASGSSNDARKAPAPFTSAAAAVSGPTVTTTLSYEGRRLVVGIDGTGFNASTLPGDQGVYVAISPSGTFPETDDIEDQEKVAATDWVRPAQMPDGSFSVSLSPENKYLDPAKQYSLYTWQAHAHSNDSQDTETPLDIDWAQLAGPTKLATKLKAPTTKKAGLLVAKVTGDATPAQGKVSVQLTKSRQKTRLVTAKLVDGIASVKLPKASAKGTWKARVSFRPSTAAYASTTKTVRFKVR